MFMPRDLYIITTARKRDTKEWEGDMLPFLITTNPEVSMYKHTVVVDSWNNIGKYAKVSGAFFIFDEQRVVGSGAWVKAFLKIAKQNQWILLSATPGDTWMDYIPVFIANGFYKNRSEFIREHVVYVYGAKWPRVDHYMNVGRLIKHRSDILVDMDFKRPTTSHNVYKLCEYDKVRYSVVVERRKNPWTMKPIKNISEYCQTLRRVVNSDPSRLEITKQIAREKEKLIIFYNFDYELELLKQIDYGSDFAMAEWNGHKHEPVPDSSKWVYFVQYTAGAEGWNCIETDTILFYSQNYSYKIMQQSSGRIDRLNTPFTDLYFYHLVSRASIDAGIRNALKKKQKFNERKWAA